jgi:hypothetical protein
MRNAGSKTLFGYAAARNFARAASDEERAQKVAILQKHQPHTKEYLLKHEAEICWLSMHKNQGLQCTYGMTNSNCVEETNNHVYQLRGSLPTHGIEEAMINQSRQFSLKRALAQGYQNAGMFLRILTNCWLCYCLYCFC